MSNFPSSVCYKGVKNNQNAIFCDICLKWCHLKCTHLSKTDHNALSNTSEPWFCPLCLSGIFPFNSIQDDVEYLFALYNSTHSNMQNTNLIKHAQQIHLTAKIRPCNSNIDPDKYFYNQFTDTGSAHYLDDELNGMIVNK